MSKTTMEYAKLAIQDLPWEEPFKDQEQYAIGTAEHTRMDLMVPTTRGIMGLAAQGKLTGWQVAYLSHLEDCHQAGKTTTMSMAVHGPEWNQLVDLGIIGHNPEPGPVQADMVNRAKDWNWMLIKEARTR